MLSVFAHREPQQQLEPHRQQLLHLRACAAELFPRTMQRWNRSLPWIMVADMAMALQAKLLRLPSSMPGTLTSL
jgi:hypothetical protein